MKIWHKRKNYILDFRRFLEIDQSETRIACGGHVCKWIKTE
jgi:hypothetical protein